MSSRGGVWAFVGGIAIALVIATYVYIPEIRRKRYAYTRLGFLLGLIISVGTSLRSKVLSKDGAAMFALLYVVLLSVGLALGYGTDGIRQIRRRKKSE